MLPTLLDDCELGKLMAVVLSDTGHQSIADGLPPLPKAANGDYYQMPLQWFAEHDDIKDFVGKYIACAESVTDFETYFEWLCSLHKRRRKYERILSAQPLPQMIQVSPRALLEFGIITTPALASWLIWRKWFFDIDNRSAQETGYLFEPILASALGGQPYAAQQSPIKRASNNSKGRQVDCIVGSDAYEFKMRVTIAPSGKGRMSEEFDFPKDCHSSGFNPVLLVLDPTPNDRLADLCKEYKRFDGSVFVGDDAWQHLEEESGPTIATLIEKYVRRPIATLDEHSEELLDLYVGVKRDHSAIHFKLGTGESAYRWNIKRSEDPRLADEPDSDAAEA